MTWAGGWGGDLHCSRDASMERPGVRGQIGRCPFPCSRDRMGILMPGCLGASALCPPGAEHYALLFPHPFLSTCRHGSDHIALLPGVCAAPHVAMLSSLCLNVDCMCCCSLVTTRSSFCSMQQLVCQPTAVSKWACRSALYQAPGHLRLRGEHVGWWWTGCRLKQCQEGCRWVGHW